VPHALAKALDRELRRTVDPPASAPDEAAGRRDVDDRPGTLLAHDGKNCAGDGEQTEDVDVEDRSRLGVGYLFDGAEQTAPRVVDKRVDPAEPREGCRDRRGRLTGAGDVERQGKEGVTGIRDRFRYRLGIPRGGGDLVAASDRLTGDLDTEATRGPVMNQTLMGCSPVEA